MTKVEQVKDALHTYWWSFHAENNDTEGYDVCRLSADGHTIDRVEHWLSLPAAQDRVDELNARAAIAALREPSEAMKQAGWAKWRAGIERDCLVEEWQAMIDALLAEGET